MMRRYLGDLRRFGAGRLGLIALLSLVVAATEGVGLLLLVQLLDLIGSGPATGVSQVVKNAFQALGLPLTLVGVLAVYVVLIAVRATVMAVRDRGVMRFQLEFIDWERNRLFDAVARAEWLFHVRRRQSDLLHTMATDLARIGQGTNALVQLTTRVIMCAVYVLVAVRLSPALTSLALAVSFLLAGVMMPLVRRSHRLGSLQTTTWRQSYGELTDFLAGIKLAKSHGTEVGHAKEFDRSLTEVREAKLGFQRTRSLASTGYQIATAAVIAGLVWIGAERLSIPSPQLIVLVVIFARILPVAGNMLGDLQDAANMLPAYASAMEVLDEACEAEEPQGQRPSEPVRIENAIELRDVTFKYPDSPRPALDHICLRLPARRITALVGHSGAGKTTLADVVLGLLQPNAGSVLVDGTDLEEVGLAAWRSAVSYVPQDPFLFHESLRANVTWATDTDMSDEQVLDLLRLAALGDLAASMPNGLDTVVGDRGLRLSGGERQRVVLARALGRQPSLLVLDEATSSLDVGNERAVRDAIEGLRGGLTVLLIAHRLSTVRHADQIVVLDGGQVCEAGTWDELLANEGRFAAMVGADSTPIA